MLDTGNQELLNAVSTWGYPAMFILMVLEGPITTLTASFLSSLGYFHPIAVFWLSLVGDISGDIILYAIGRYGGRRALQKADKFLDIKKGIIPKIEKLFHKKGAKIIFSVKATTGLVYITFILAGATRMNFRKFFYYSFLGGIVWSSLLVLLGYFLGEASEQINQYIKYAGVVIFLTVIVFFILISIFRKERTDDILGSKQ